MRLVCIVFLITVFSLISSPSRAEQQTVYNAGSSKKGINVFETSWVAILAEAGLNINYIKADFIQRRELFDRGEIVLECCSIPEWHKDPEEQKIQLYTRPFFSTYEHIVHKESAILDTSNLTDLWARRVSFVKGFHYRGAEHFQYVIYFDTLSEAMRAVSKGDVEFSIVNNQEFGKFQRQHNAYDLVLGDVWEHIPMAIRVRREQAHLVPRINKAINILRAKGIIARLIGITLRVMPD